MSNIKEIAKSIEFIKLDDARIEIHAKPESIPSIRDYLVCENRAIVEEEEKRLIIKKDPEKEKKFGFVKQIAFVLSEEVKKYKSDGKTVPSDLFSVIIGHENLKKIFFRAIEAKKPVHILLYGPPSTAKSLFLSEIERLPNAIFCTGGELTGPGLRDIIAEYAPRYLIIDELDKVRNHQDISCLLSWMEFGRIIIGKYRDYRVIEGEGWIFGAANRLDKFTPEFISRFLTCYVREYTKLELKEVIRKVLRDREKIEGDIADYIAEKVLENGYKDVRDAIRIGRLARSNEDVDTLLEIFASGKNIPQ